MCDLYYLDQYREAAAEAGVAEAEELMQDAKVSMKALSERTAKLALDLAFMQVSAVHNNEAVKARLVRYAIELCRKATNDLKED